MKLSENTPHPTEQRACDREPIHTPGLIQPHGFLLAVSPKDWTVQHASQNITEHLGLPVEQVLGREIADVIGDAAARSLRRVALDPLFTKRPIFIDRLRRSDASGRPMHALVAHQHSGVIFVEGEVLAADAMMLADTHYQLEEFLAHMESAPNAATLLRMVALETRRITGFDRVLIYRFDPDWNGIVVAEDRNDVLPSYLDLRFPASDIPRQARELYRINRLRLIANGDYRAVPIIAKEPGAAPLDLSLSTLRSVSPVHLEYMRNMGTGSSMSISLLRGGNLWGLISCHSREPKLVSFETRTACDLLGQVLSLQLAAREESARLTERMELRTVLGRLLAAMSRENSIRHGLLSESQDLLALTKSTGAAIVIDGEIAVTGQAPTREQLTGLVGWIDKETQTADVIVSDALAEAYPPAAEFISVACGLLAVSLSRVNKSFVLWFRPEIVRTVRWGGDPEKKIVDLTPSGAMQLHPRKSFEDWVQIVRGRSQAWEVAEIETARELRTHIANIVLQNAERLAALNEELTRTNRELEAFSYTVSHDLRAPFRHIRAYGELLKSDKAKMLDDEGRQYIDYVLGGAAYAGRMVDNILAFSQMGRAALNVTEVPLDQVVQDVLVTLGDQVREREIQWHIEKLPTVPGDAHMIRTAVQNLIENAIKFTRDRAPAEISITNVPSEKPEHVICVADNGVGFDMKYHHKLFGMFQRLHRWEEFEGTGIGLASVRRIILRHGGRVWADSALGRGSKFFIALPKEPIPTSPLYA